MLRHVTTRHDTSCVSSIVTSCVSCRDVSWRDATSGIWAIWSGYLSVPVLDPETRERWVSESTINVDN